MRRVEQDEITLGGVLRPDVAAGDRVLFGKYAGTQVKSDGDDHPILNQSDILGVLAKAEKLRAAA